MVCERCVENDKFINHLCGELIRRECIVESSSPGAEFKRKLLKADVAFWGSDWEGNPWKGGKYLGAKLCLNMNDTFAPAADAEAVPDEEVERVWKIYIDHGNEGLTAWVALRRNQDPLPCHDTVEYRRAKQAIQES